MFCKHLGNSYGCTGRICRYRITVMLMIVNLFLLAHILFPHHHHFYSISCGQEQAHDACEVEIEKALPRAGSDRYEQYAAASADDEHVAPFFPMLQPASFRSDLCRMQGRRFLYPLLTLRCAVRIVGGAHSLRAPPALAL